MKNLVDIRDFFQNERFQRIQDAIASSIDLAIITVDYKGIPISQHSSRIEFCTIMRKSEYFSKLCERCDSRGGIEAARTQSPYIYLCHAGLVDFAIPIIIDNKYLGAVMAGEVFLSNKEENQKLERIIHNNFEDNVSLKDINTLRAYKSIPVMPLDKIKTIANMLFSICTMMVDETRLRASIDELRKNQACIHVDKEYINTYTQIISNQYFDLTVEMQNTNLLTPAFDYIRENLTSDLSIKKVASTCNISPSYFSKLFSKENLGSYSDYINKTRIEHAKRILFSTNMPINEIAVKLRYSDCGYFIKVFKKFEGITPAIYRAIKTKGLEVGSFEQENINK